MLSQGRPLLEVLAEIPDFRAAQGQRHPLSAILALGCCAALCGYRSYSAMAEWGRNYGARLVQALGFTRAQTPCAATLHTVFRQLEVTEFEARLGAWAESWLGAEAGPDTRVEGVAVDGKTLRGSRKQGAAGTHLLSALSHRLGVTLGQQAVEAKTNEIPQAEELLTALVIAGRVFTMDALLTQKELAQQIVDGGGDYVMIVKGNQPQLQADIATVFALGPAPDEQRQQAQTVEIGHGRIEQRALTSSDVLAGYCTWPGLQQVFQVVRETTEKKSGKERAEIVYGVTSLRMERAAAPCLLGLVRGQWTIENRSHWVRDVTFDEDRSQVRTGNVPQVIAALRNTAIGLLRLAGETNIAAACRRMAAQPEQALALIGINLKTE
jgi:predicted transposase YbfD/YdcC